MAGMLVSMSCYITAFLVEVGRLKVMKHRKNVNPIPMKMFLLVPQFCLLGVMQGLTEDGLNVFFSDQVSSKPMKRHAGPIKESEDSSESTKRYAGPFNEFVLGIESFISIPVVKFLPRGLEFGHSNESSLIKSYGTLFLSSFLNFLYTWFISNRCYRACSSG
uniref:Uncharacterized protein n=1 Tax=Nelumbo nucifera TaxID=4432 RepID=A0A822ZIU3_NELNU|nr:TPA_asm: hypothetical protein HUJ06_001166 [Nelumbo nucifera]